MGRRSVGVFDKSDLGSNDERRSCRVVGWTYTNIKERRVRDFDCSFDILLMSKVQMERPCNEERERDLASERRRNPWPDEVHLFNLCFFFPIHLLLSNLDSHGSRGQRDLASFINS